MHGSSNPWHQLSHSQQEKIKEKEEKAKEEQRLANTPAIVNLPESFNNFTGYDTGIQWSVHTPSSVTMPGNEAVCTLKGSSGEEDNNVTCWGDFTEGKYSFFLQQVPCKDKCPVGPHTTESPGTKINLLCQKNTHTGGVLKCADIGPIGHKTVHGSYDNPWQKLY